MSEPVQTVFLVDDDASFLRSIERLLRSSGYATESFTSAEDFLTRCARGARGCAVLDLQMPGMDGLAAQTALGRSGNPLPVVFLTGQGDIPTCVKAMRRGAEDFLVKTAPREQVLAAIERALAHETAERVARVRRHELQARFEKLTPRERQVLAHLIQGRRNKAIAADMGIDERSVKRHRTHLMKKLELQSVAELVRLSIEAGIPLNRQG